jgi:hypothetical protein
LYVHNLHALLAASSTAAVASQIRREATALAALLDVATLSADVEKDTLGVLIELRQRLEVLSGRIEDAGP